MIRTTKRVMTILLTLCLVATWLPTAALADGGTATISVEPTSFTAGVTSGGTITVTATGGTFSEANVSTYITVSGYDGKGLEFGQAQYQDTTTVTIAATGTPTEAGTITITAQPDAFEDTGKPSEALTQTITVNGANADVTASGDLKVGQSGEIQLKSTGIDFANSLQTDMFTVSIDGESQTVTSPGDGGGTDTTSLTLTPTKTGTVSVTIKPEAFAYKPASDVTASGSVTVSLPTVTASYNGTTLTAGTEGTINVTASGNFAASPAANLFTLNGGGVTQPDSVEASGTGATLKVTPTKGGTIEVTSIAAAAFEPQSASAVTPNGSAITVNAAPNVDVTSSDSLKAGEQPNTITLTISNGNNEFTSDSTSYYTLSDVTGLTVSSVSASGTTATLTVTGAPDAQGTLKVTVDPAAFKYTPASASEVSISVAAATVSATVEGSLTVGKEGTFTVTATGSDFASTNPDASLFTLSGGGVTQPTSVTATGNTATLTVTPTTATPITVTSIGQTAFKYQPTSPVEPSGQATVNAPTGSVSAELEGDALYAGTETSGQTIKLTASGDLTFKSSLSTANTGYFTLSGDGSTGLSVTNVTYTSSTEVSLTLSGTPKNSGAIEVTVSKDAFTYAPTDGQKATGSISVKEAPSVTLSGNEITAGNTNEITIQITNPDEAKFISGVTANKFTISGDGYTSLTVSEAAITDSGTNKNVKLTLSDTPTTNGTMTVTVTKDAFTPVAADKATASITVNQPDGSVTGSLAGGTATLTAGTAVTDTSISLTAGSTLNFKAQAQLSPENFTLSGDTGLTISGVTRSDSKNVSLSLTGTPKAGGTFTVTAQTSAFVAAPAAAKTTGSLTIGYPDVSVSPDPNHIAEEDDSVHSIKLTATNGVFNAVSGANENFSFSSNITGITLSGVTATDGSNEATLAFTGTPESTGDLTITVQPGAFKYQPLAAVTAKVKIGKPEGTLSATLNGALYKGTPVSNQTIAVTISNSHGLHFKDSGLAATDFALINTDPGGLTITPAYVDPTHVTLTLSGTPSNSGTFQVQAKTTAFKLAPEGDITASDSITVNAAPTGSVSASLSGQLTAGMPVGSSTSITLTPTTLSFAAGLDTGKFTLNNADGLSISRVGSSGGNVVLALSGTPNAHTDNFTITVDRTAFTYYPDSNVTTSAVTINYPTIELDATPKHIAEGDETATSITLTATGSVFNTTEATDYFSVSGDTGVTLSAVKVETEGDTAVLTITPPTTEGALTITVQPDAFKYKPENAATATVSVGPPMGTLTGTLSGSLYAGTPVSGQTITVTISNSHGLHFKDSGLTAEDFALGGAGAAGLTIASVSGSGEAVTLTLSGTPTKAGAVTVTAKTTAFKLATDEDQTVTGSITVNAAPTVTVTTDSKLTVGAKADDITLTASGSSFKSDITKNVTLSGDAAQGLTVSAVTVSGATATLTLSGTPTTAGELTVTISKDAFQPQAATDVTVTVTVNPKGTIEVESEGGGASLNMSSAELADAVLSEAERQMLANGASIEITLTEENVGSAVTATQRSTVQAAARGYTVGAYLNVELIKSINGGEGTLISETNKPIQVTFKIPAELIKEGRKFGVVRLHDGTASLLDTVSSTSDTITVESKLFSLYAIVYQDGTPTASPSASPSASQQPVAPNTGDSAPLGLYTALLALCLTGLAVTLIRRKKNVR